VATSQSIGFTYDPTFYWGTTPVPIAGVTFEGNSIDFDGAPAGSNFRVIAGTGRDSITRLTNVDKLRFAVDFSSYDKVSQPWVNVNAYLVSRYDGMVPVTYRDSAGNIQGTSRYYDAQGGGTNTYGIELDIFESNGYALFQHTGHASDTLFSGNPDPAANANGGAWSYSSSSQDDDNNMLNTALAGGVDLWKSPSQISAVSEAKVVVDGSYQKFRIEVDLPQESGETMQIKRYDFDDDTYSGSYDLLWDSTWSFPGQDSNPVEVSSIIDANQVGLYLFAGAQQGFVPPTTDYYFNPSLANPYQYPSNPLITLGWSDIEAVYSDSYSAQGVSIDKSSISAKQSLVGSSRSDNIRGSAMAKNIISGKDGFDLLTGGSSADKLNGGAQADVLVGKAGRDVLNGGRGDDVLIGGHGADLLIGGEGADKYVYETISDSGSRSSADLIEGANFNNQDKIVISSLLSDRSRFSFINGKEFQGNAGEFRLDGTVLMGDLNGDKRADFFINFSKTSLNFLGAEDFVIA